MTRLALAALLLAAPLAADQTPTRQPAPIPNPLQFWDWMEQHGRLQGEGVDQEWLRRITVPPPCRCPPGDCRHRNKR